MTFTAKLTDPDKLGRWLFKDKALVDFRLIFKSVFNDLAAAGGLRGFILEQFWIHFGASGGPFSNLRWSIFECPGAFS